MFDEGTLRNTGNHKAVRGRRFGGENERRLDLPDGFYEEDSETFGNKSDQIRRLELVRARTSEVLRDKN